MAEKWIQEAIQQPGALTRKARRAGMTIEQYCARKDLDTESKRQCNLAKTLKKLPKRGE